MLFLACSKDGDNTPRQPAVVTKLTKSEWKINSITRPKISNPATDSVISNESNISLPLKSILPANWFWLCRYQKITKLSSQNPTSERI